ncbi:MAG TPA: helix-turn-helix domain-containing protein [Kribbella sp.]|uniref:helix-turn-helix domain-containing protein n=1 Tax=Kribbella sp. TaxID=1871183 RepID=UPI002D76E886|nr:helix-turn-helix domain-containing protein [Kribbella sp.]HET6299719.1 helix-turn-helix domain-containing protein [Kribbella sp.]
MPSFDDTRCMSPATKSRGMQVHTVRDLGAAVRQARTDQKMSQAELAAKVGVSRNWIMRLEKGHPRLEAQLVLDAMAAAGVALTTDTDDESLLEPTDSAWTEVFADLAVKPKEDSDSRLPSDDKPPSDG